MTHAPQTNRLAPGHGSPAPISVQAVAACPPLAPSHGRRRLLLQLQALDASITGGLVAYVRRAAALLKDSEEGKNPLEGYAPSIPAGHQLELGSPEFVKYEAVGASARCGFVVVAGGLGERLGYSGVKLELPPELLTGTPYLQLYAQHVLALQRQQRLKEPSSPLLPLIIMTSDDTDLPTRAIIARLGTSPLHPLTPLTPPYIPSLGMPARALIARLGEIGRDGADSASKYAHAVCTRARACTHTHTRARARACT